MTHKFSATLRKHKPFLHQLGSSLEGLFWLILFCLVVFSTSCNKDTVQSGVKATVENPSIQMSLESKETPFWGRIELFDFDKDNFLELILEMLPVGDPILQLEHWFCTLKPAKFTYFTFNSLDQVGLPANGEMMPPDCFDGYEQNHGIRNCHFRKIIDLVGNILGEGNREQPNHKLLPIKVLKSIANYAGWLEISAEPEGQKEQLYCAGISCAPNAALMECF